MFKTNFIIKKTSKPQTSRHPSIHQNHLGPSKRGRRRRIWEEKTFYWWFRSNWYHLTAVRFICILGKFAKLPNCSEKHIKIHKITACMMQKGMKKLAKIYTLGSAQLQSALLTVSCIFALFYNISFFFLACRELPKSNTAQNEQKERFVNAKMNKKYLIWIEMIFSSFLAFF